MGPAAPDGSQSIDGPRAGSAQLDVAACQRPLSPTTRRCYPAVWNCRPQLRGVVPLTLVQRPRGPWAILGSQSQGSDGVNMGGGTWDRSQGGRTRRSGARSVASPQTATSAGPLHHWALPSCNLPLTHRPPQPNPSLKRKNKPPLPFRLGCEREHAGKGFLLLFSSLATPAVRGAC